MSNKVAVWQVTADSAGQRLDAALATFLPGLGLRARRRLWDTHTVLVNDKPRPTGWMLREHDSICLHPKNEDPAPATAEHKDMPSAPPVVYQQEAAPHVIAQHGNLIFLYKPAGLHTSSLEGRGGPSLEALLPELCAEHAPLHLVNRLDCGTSGIVAAALSEHDARQWRRMEDAGLCKKRYYALLCGHLPSPLTIRNRLDTAKRRVSKVLPVETHDTLRHTRFTPLSHMPPDELHKLTAALFEAGLKLTPAAEQDCTLALCSIAKGARHQIRAHALCAGFPLWGDSLYACSLHSLPPVATGHNFLLHHGALVMPGLHVQCPPLWLPLLPEPAQQALRTLVG